MRIPFMKLAERNFEAVPLDSEDGRGARAVERLLHNLKLNGVAAGALSPECLRLLSGVFAGSSFLSGIAERELRLVFETLDAAPEEQVDSILARAREEAVTAGSVRDIMRVLRQAKSQIAFVIALADLAGVWTVDEVTQRFTEAADCFVSLAVNYLLKRAAEAGQLSPPISTDPQAGSGLIVLGMGKYGAFELNYSSDIDLIIFFDRAIAPLARNIEPQSFFVRLTRDLVHILQERTADGYVFRTDLRLRPDPGSTQAAISTDAAFRYYETLGQNWERAALIKARPVAGDIAAGQAFLQALGPYIWRKYLDYNAIADIHAMKRQIHAAKGHERIAIAGHNLKLGRGGIREIEFFVQSQQLIAGGRQPKLRTRQTLEGLQLLTEFDWIGPKVRDDLTEAYRYLRRIEHRLQMVADQQTHTLPANADELERFSRFAGYERLAEFRDELLAHMQAVERHYAALFEKVPDLTPQTVPGNLVFTGDADDPGTIETLRKLGFKNPSAAIAAVKGWHYGRYKAMQSERAREMLTEFTPHLLEALGRTGDPDLALATFDKFLSEIPAAVQLFSLLRANPELFRLLAQIMGSAPRLARILSRRRRLMDAILDPGHLGGQPGFEEVRALVRREIMDAGSYEERLNQARICGQEQAFFIGVQLLSRQLSPEDAGHAYSSLAAALVETLADVVQAQFGGPFPPPAIFGMGKLGGSEMTASSDLDLIAVYEVPPELESQAPQHYARYTQRLIAALSAPTSEGELYPVDMRLRPSGKAGPLAVRLQSFISYQRDEAWTWEHLALTRARVIAGPGSLPELLKEEIRQILTLRRDRAKAAADVTEMRAMIEAEKGTSDLWQTKTHRGGLIDVEFIAQFLQIVHAADEPAILSQNTAQALRNLTDAGFLKPGDGKALVDAAELYQAVAHILRLCTEGVFQAQSAPRDLIELLLNVTGTESLPALEAHLKATYASTAGLFQEYVAN
jgi:glutamate-ammonia-ligase adenylyltransferase